MPKMNIVTGHCYPDYHFRGMEREVFNRWQRISTWLLVVLLMCLSMLPLLMSRNIKDSLKMAALSFPCVVYCLFHRRYGYDTEARYLLSDQSAKILSPDPKVQREIAWSEVSSVQVAKWVSPMRRFLPRMEHDYYVLVRGQENRMITTPDPETYGSLMGHPNRISVPKTAETEAVIRQKSTELGFPIIEGYVL